MNQLPACLRRKQTIITIPADLERLQRVTFAIANVAEAKFTARETPTPQ